ncbi:MAG: DUF4258 domain-containing protein [Defluviicoccus sp.]
MNHDNISASVTKHAKKRCQQRSISPFIVEALLASGDRVPSLDGAEMIFFGKRAKHALKQQWGAQILSRLEDMLNVSIIVKNDTVITAMHRTARIKRF